MDSSAATAGEATTENATLAITPRTATPTRISGSRLGRIAEQRVDERLGLEGCEVVGTFAQPDQLDRDSQLALDGDDDAALGGAVELGQHDAGDVDDLGEHPSLNQAVLTRGRIEDEEHLVDRAAPLDDALDLAELVHQALLGVQPAGGVDQDRVCALLDACLDRVERDARGIGAFRAADDRRADTVRPGGEL